MRHRLTPGFILILTLALALWVFPAAIGVPLLGQSSPLAPTPTPVPTPTPLPTPTPVPTPTPLPTPTPSPTFSPTPSPLPTSTPSPTFTLQPSPTPIVMSPTPAATYPSPTPSPAIEPPPPEPTPPVLLLPDFTPIPTYAPPLYIPPTQEWRVAPTEVATPWPVAPSIDRSVLSHRAFVPYVRLDWAYLYPFLQVVTPPTPEPPMLYVWAQQVDALLLALWHIVPSFLCLFVAILLSVVLLAIQRRRRGSPDNENGA